MRKILIAALAAVCALTTTACINKETVLAEIEATEATTVAAEETTVAEETTTQPEETTTQPEETTTEEITVEITTEETTSAQPDDDGEFDSIKVVNGNVVVTSTQDSVTCVITYVFNSSTVERIDVEFICKNEKIAQETYDIVSAYNSEEFGSYYTDFELDGNILRARMIDEITAMYQGIDRDTLLVLLGGESYGAETEPTYTVIITAYSTTDKIKLVNALKNYLDIELTEAKSLVESTPVIIATGLSEAEAEELEDLLENAGAEVETEEENDDASERYMVVLESYGDSKMSVITTLMDYLDLGLAEAKDLAESAPVIVATGLSEAEAEELEELLEAAGGEADAEEE